MDYPLRVLLLLTVPVAASEAIEPACSPGTFAVASNSCVCGNVPYPTTDRNLERFTSIAYCHILKSEQTGKETLRGVIRATEWAGLVKDKQGNDQFATAHCLYHHCIGNISGITLPEYFGDLNVTFCKGKNRIGLVCSACAEGYGVSINKPDLECAECGEINTVLAVFIWMSAEILPMILLVAVFLILDIPLVSGPMNTFLLFAHTFRNMNYYANGILDLTDGASGSSDLSMLSWVTWLYSLFSMEFISTLPVFPPLCVKEGTGDMFYLVFQYIPGFLPVVFIIIVYMLQLLYRREPTCCCCVYWMMKKCHALVARIQHAMGRHSTSIKRGLCTFLLLSYAKISYISFLLISQANFQSKGDIETRFLLNPEWTYFGEDHLPYALPALFIIIIFTVIPALMLLIYKPLFKCKCCQKIKFLTKPLGTFMDIYTECFKHKYYFFGGLLFLFRALTGCTYAFLDLVDQYVPQMCLTAVYLMFTLICQPYKLKWLNIWDSIVYSIILLLNGIILYSYHKVYINLQEPNKFFFTIQQILIFVPLLYFLIMPIIYCAIKRFGKHHVQNVQNYGAIGRQSDENSSEDQDNEVERHDHNSMRNSLLFTGSEDHRMTSLTIKDKLASRWSSFASCFRNRKQVASTDNSTARVTFTATNPTFDQTPKLIKGGGNEVTFQILTASD